MRNLVLAAISTAVLTMAGAAQATIVNINAQQNGEQTGGNDCSQACEGALIAPVQVTLGPGTYTLNDAYSTVTGLAPGALYDAWNFGSGWVWHWKVLTDDGAGGATITQANYASHLLFDVDPTQTFGSESAAAAFGASTPAPVLTLGSTTTLDFVVNDFGLGDNAGGVSLDIVRQSTGGVPEPAAWALMLAGFGGLGAVLRRRRAVGVRAVLV